MVVRSAEVIAMFMPSERFDNRNSFLGSEIIPFVEIQSDRMLVSKFDCAGDQFGVCCRVQMVARCAEDILAARGVKPTLSPNLNVLATVEALDVKRLLFIGVGCQVLHRTFFSIFH